MMIHYSARKFARHPLSLLQFAVGNKNPFHEVMLADAAKKLLGKEYDASTGRVYLDEIRNWDFVPMNKSQDVKLSGNLPVSFFGKFIYFIVRCMKPERIVETGV